MKVSKQTISTLRKGFDDVSAIINELLTLNNEDGKGNVLVAVAGGSCSGKSFFGRKLKEVLEKMGIRVSVLGWDDYYKDITDPSFPHDSEGRAIFDLPQSYLADEFRNDVMALLKGRDVMSPIYSKRTNLRLVKEKRPVEARGVIITEGLFVVDTLFDYPDVVKIFINTEECIRIGRRIARDTGRLHDTVEDTLRFIRERVDPYYLEHVHPQINIADIVIENNWEKEQL